MKIYRTAKSVSIKIISQIHENSNTECKYLKWKIIVQIYTKSHFPLIAIPHKNLFNLHQLQSNYRGRIKSKTVSHHIVKRPSSTWNFHSQYQPWWKCFHQSHIINHIQYETSKEDKLRERESMAISHTPIRHIHLPSE